METHKDPLAEITSHDEPIQLSNKTRLDRHPYVFLCVKDVVAAAAFRKPRILSFGCSTGEEVHTLSSIYFPEAELLGVDIDDEVIQTARDAYGAMANVAFQSAGERPLVPASFDVIFAMSVLCRWPSTRNMDDIAELYPFAAFEQHVAHLDSLLKPGGVLVIFNSSYSFLLSNVSQRYDLIADPRLARAGNVKRFRRNGRAYRESGGTDCVFVKHRDPANTNADCLTLRDAQLRPITIIDRDLATDEIPAGSS